MKIKKEVKKAPKCITTKHRWKEKTIWSPVDLLFTHKNGWEYQECIKCEIIRGREKKTAPRIQFVETSPTKNGDDLK